MNAKMKKRNIRNREPMTIKVMSVLPVAIDFVYLSIEKSISATLSRITMIKTMK